MNDPNDTYSQVEDALENLEEEYMALAEAGDRKAWDFAMEESVINTCAQGLIMMMIVEGRGKDDRRLAQFTRSARDVMLDRVSKHVAPIWARAEYVKRGEEARELQDDFMESEWPEVVQR